MAKYRKKPIVIEAEQFWPDQKPWPVGVARGPDDILTGGRTYWMVTLEGPFVVTPGDWIITGVKGEKYPCKPDIFEMTYEQAAPWVPTKDS
jgi:hypothetical protein